MDRYRIRLVVRRRDGYFNGYFNINHVVVVVLVGRR